MKEMILDIILHIADIRETLSPEDKERHDRAAWYLNAALQELKECKENVTATCK